MSINAQQSSSLQMELDVSLMEGKPFRSKLSMGSMGKKKGGGAFVK